MKIDLPGTLRPGRGVRFGLVGAWLSAVAVVVVGVLASCASTDTESARPGSTDHGAASEPPTERLVVLVSLDGFRWDYLERGHSPWLEELAGRGVHAQRLVPVFPTKTFPNHYTLVTGLYPDHHGIVANNMYDPDFDAVFGLSLREEVTDARWWEGEPVWVTAQRQGLRTGVYFWPGSEAPIGGVLPNDWKTFDDDIPGADRVDEILGWLDRSAAERPDFVTLYFSDVDSTGHRYGPDAPEVAEAIARVDGWLARLDAGLEARGLRKQTTYVIVSDHGMAAAPTQLYLNDYIDLSEVRVVALSTLALLRPHESTDTGALMERLEQVPGVRFYRRSELPEELSYGTHRRVPEIVGLVEEGIVLSPARPSGARTRPPAIGQHGYESKYESMHGLFVAAGPDLATGKSVDEFRSIDLYELLCRLLGVDPAANDGDAARIREVLAQ